MGQFTGAEVSPGTSAEDEGPLVQHNSKIILVGDQSSLLIGTGAAPLTKLLCQEPSDKVDLPEPRDHCSVTDKPTTTLETTLYIDTSDTKTTSNKSSPSIEKAITFHREEEVKKKPIQDERQFRRRRRKDKKKGQARTTILSNSSPNRTTTQRQQAPRQQDSTKASESMDQHDEEEDQSHDFHIGMWGEDGNLPHTDFTGINYPSSSFIASEGGGYGAGIGRRASLGGISLPRGGGGGGSHLSMQQRQRQQQQGGLHSAHLLPPPPAIQQIGGDSHRHLKRTRPISSSHHPSPLPLPLSNRQFPPGMLGAHPGNNHLSGGHVSLPPPPPPPLPNHHQMHHHHQASSSRHSHPNNTSSGGSTAPTLHSLSHQSPSASPVVWSLESLATYVQSELVAIIHRLTCLENIVNQIATNHGLLQAPISPNSAPSTTGATGPHHHHHHHHDHNRRPSSLTPLPLPVVGLREITRGHLDRYCLPALEQTPDPPLAAINRIAQDLETIYSALDRKTIVSQIRKWFRKRREEMGSRIISALKRQRNLSEEQLLAESEDWIERLENDEFDLTAIVNDARLELSDEQVAKAFAKQKILSFLKRRSLKTGD